MRSEIAAFPTVPSFTNGKAVADGTQPCALARTEGDAPGPRGVWEGWRDPAGEVLQTFTIATNSRCTSG